MDFKITPIENITFSQKQERLFDERLSIKLNPTNKLNKPYEFGNKVGIAVSGRGNFVLGIKSFHGNPYDGHTLDQTVVELRKLSPETSKIFVDPRLHWS